MPEAGTGCPGAASMTRLRRTGKRALATALLFGAFWGMAAFLQWRGGAYSAEFTGFPDEPSHYVTALMVRDYIAAGFPGNPIRYAEQYYLHYPKVSFGMWGPLFPATLGLWLLVSAGRAWVLLGMAAVTAALAAVLARVLQKQYSLETGLLAGAALVASPLIQSSTSMVMGDNLCALLEFLACLWFARYLRTGKSRDSIVFGVLASLAILAKPSGVALGLLPPIAVLLTRRFALLRSRAFWYPALIVLVIAGPWQVLEVRLLAGMPRAWNPAWAYPLASYLVRMIGVWVFPLVIVGVVGRLGWPAGREGSEIWISAAGLAIAAWVYHFALPVGAAEPRYMTAALPPALMFLAAGVHWAAERMPIGRPGIRAKAAVVWTIAAAVFATQTFAIPQKRHLGFQEAAEALLARPDLRDAVILTSSEADGEGLLISEIAMREKRPGHIILRASKVLGQSDWTSRRYRLLLGTTAEVMQYLDKIPVGAVEVERGRVLYHTPHQQLLERTIHEHGGRFQLIGTYREPRGGASIDVYAVLGQRQRPRGEIEIQMPYTWGRAIRN
jgi:hypothetical protein